MDGNSLHSALVYVVSFPANVYPDKFDGDLVSDAVMYEYFVYKVARLTYGNKKFNQNLFTITFATVQVGVIGGSSCRIDCRMCILIVVL